MFYIELLLWVWPNFKGGQVAGICNAPVLKIIQNLEDLFFICILAKFLSFVSCKIARNHFSFIPQPHLIPKEILWCCAYYVDRFQTHPLPPLRLFVQCKKGRKGIICQRHGNYCLKVRGGEICLF